MARWGLAEGEKYMLELYSTVVSSLLQFWWFPFHEVGCRVGPVFLNKAAIVSESQLARSGVAQGRAWPGHRSSSVALFRTLVPPLPWIRLCGSLVAPCVELWLHIPPYSATLATLASWRGDLFIQWILLGSLLYARYSHAGDTAVKKNQTNPNPCLHGINILVEGTDNTDKY